MAQRDEPEPMRARQRWPPPCQTPFRLLVSVLLVAIWLSAAVLCTLPAPSSDQLASALSVATLSPRHHHHHAHHHRRSSRLFALPENFPSHHQPHLAETLHPTTEWQRASSKNAITNQSSIWNGSVQFHSKWPSSPPVTSRAELTLTQVSTQPSSSPSDASHTTESDQIFLRHISVRVVLITLYTIVFLAIFIGNTLLIAALALNREMLTVTNIFLLNLSIADLCVAFFCVYQNLSLYLLSNWIFGDFLCRMYHFIHAMSYTASVCIHVVIALERYLALVKPFWARVLLTKHRLRLMIVTVWCLSAVACSPRFFIYKTIVSYFTSNGFSEDEQHSEILCVISYHLYNPKIYDTLYIAIFFAMPLVLIGFLYFRISFHLWRSTASAPQLSESRISSFSSTNSPSRLPFKNQKAFRTQQQRDDLPEIVTNNCNNSCNNELNNRKERQSNRYSMRQVLIRARSADTPTTAANKRTLVEKTLAGNGQTGARSGSRMALWSSLGGSDINLDHSVSSSIKSCRGGSARHHMQMERILAKRRKVVKLMMTIVICFALFSVPFHLRKLLQHFDPHYEVASDLATIFTMATTLLLYANSAVNPILYMCFSTKIRRLMLIAAKQLFCCQCAQYHDQRSRAGHYSISLRSMPDRSLIGPKADHEADEL